ncbi:MAG TPA: acyl-CoA dehydrogenase family protein [Solirubrobacteraceae bacterium]|nr:acyl-CoA dehydrogenase family protein [Solirubrobacteraceae bacterium]
MSTQKSVAQRSMGLGLRALGALAGSPALDKLGMRKQTEKLIYGATKNGFRAATAASRTFKIAQSLPGPARQGSSKVPSLFDITPDDEQQMLQEAVRDFAAEKVRPAAAQADADTGTPKELLEQASELGVNMLGIPEELGGVMAQRAAVTGALIAEALAHGDMGISYAVLAPGAVASTIGLFGDADQQAAYLPAFAGEAPPAAALALLEPQPLFNPLRLSATARRDGGDWVLDGVKSLLARPGECELFVIAAEAEEFGPALFVVESSTKGLSVQAEPAMGLRAAATGRLLIEGARVPTGAILADGARAAYLECVQRARIAWCALAIGTAQAVLDYVIPYVNERTAFGEPISNRQAVAFGVADIGIETEAMRLLTYRAAARADQGADFAHVTALARRLCTAKGMKIGSEGVQLLGGHGYVKEHPVERWYRDLRAAGVMEGALLV